MYVKMDEGDVKGVLKTDGYVDARKKTPEQVAELINERVKIISG